MCSHRQSDDPKRIIDTDDGPIEVALWYRADRTPDHLSIDDGNGSIIDVPLDDPQTAVLLSEAIADVARRANSNTANTWTPNRSLHESQGT